MSPLNFTFITRTCGELPLYLLKFHINLVRVFEKEHCTFFTPALSDTTGRSIYLWVLRVKNLILLEKSSWGDSIIRLIYLSAQRDSEVMTLGFGERLQVDRIPYTLLLHSSHRWQELSEETCWNHTIKDNYLQIFYLK